MLTEETPAETASFRLSPQQEQLWRTHPNGPPLAVRCVIDVGAAETAIVENTLARALARHEILRTTFLRRQGMRLPGQVIHERLEPAWASDGHLDLARGPVVAAALSGGSGGRRVLTLTIPAVCADARSLALLAGELRARLGTETPADTEPLQYADYAEWRGESLAASEDRWEIPAGPQSPALPFAHGVDSVPGAPPVRVAVPLDGAAVVRGAGACRVPLPLFVEACWHAVLARLSGDAGACVGAVLDGRLQTELSEAVGPYAQVLPIVTAIDETTTIAEVVDQVRRARARLEPSQDSADAGVLERAAQSCRVGFSAIELPPDAGIEELVGAPAPFLAHLALLCHGDDVRAELHLAPELVTLGTADVLATTLAAFVMAAGEVNTPVADVPLSGGSAPEALAALTGAAVQGDDATVTQLFEQAAARLADGVALVAPDATLSYAELDARANRLAHRLRALGVGRDTAVGVCMERSASSIVAVLGVLKAGAAYVPLNFEHPAARLAYQLEETKAPVLLTESGVSGRLPSFDGVVLQVDDAETLAGESDARPDPVNEPDDLVYVMYTSGSTGRPKGVGVTHRNLAAYARAILDRLEMTRAEGVSFAAVSALSTDLGNTSIFASLVGGGTLHLVSPAVAMDGARFAEYLREWPIDVLKITPSHLRALLDQGAAEALPRRWLVLGGEALSWDLLERVRSAAPDCRVLNHYGPTETTVGSCTCEAAAVEARGRTVPIGRPLPGERVYVVDRLLRLVPVGVPGELCIGGAGVARGYIGQPGETADRFVVDPFANDVNRRVYRTGDRVRLLPDRTVEFLGRIDDQVKVHGHRVEPSEIEVVLEGHPAVRQCALVVRDAGDDEKQLVAYVVRSADVATEELQMYARSALPVHMVPTRFVGLDALPLGPSGKVDRRALPEPTDEPVAEYVAPQTPLEKALAGIWQELLGLERVGVHDDFFALGGHSLLATQAVIRMRSAIGDVPLHSLFNAPTISSLAEAIVAAEHQPEQAAAADQTS